MLNSSLKVNKSHLYPVCYVLATLMKSKYSIFKSVKTVLACVTFVAMVSNNSKRPPDQM